MSLKGTTISKEGLEYLCGLINKIVSSPKELLDDINLATNTTFSSVRINSLISDTLQQANTHAEAICESLIKLTCEKTTIKPTLDNSRLNVIYLYSADGNAPFEQYLKISDTELINLGSTSISLNDYLTVTDAIATYCKKTDFDALNTEVDKVKATLGNENLNTTKQTLTGGVNELKTDLTTHTSDTDIHITPAEREKWNNGANGEDIIKKADIKTTLDKNSTNTDICSGKAIFDAIKANCVGKETVLYEGNISATGTYTLADDVNNYDFIIISNSLGNGAGRQSLTMSKNEISKCIDTSHNFICAYGYSNSTEYIVGYFNNDKLIVGVCNKLNITSIIGYKFGQVTVQNTITNPSQGASYSTDEQLTGGTWIDGKPIYRKGGFVESIPNGTSPILDSTLTLSLVNVIVQTGGSVLYSAGNMLSIGGYSGHNCRANVSITNKGLVFLSSSDNYKNVYWWIEYTKKSDA